MAALLRLIRIENLIIIFITQLGVHFFILKKFTNFIALSSIQIVLLSLATCCIAAAGYIINNIYDQEIDQINNPKKRLVGTVISEKKAHNFYVFFNIIGVGVGLYLSNVIGKSNYIILFIVIASLLYLYASYLKKILIVGNLTVALCTATSIIIVPIFDLTPAIYPKNQSFMRDLFQLILYISFIAFYLNWIREMVKDVQDFKGDQAYQVRSLPVQFGLKKSKRIIIGISIGFLLILTYILNQLLDQIPSKQLPIILALGLGPYLFYLFKLIVSKSDKDYKLLSLTLKVYMLTLLLSIMYLIHY